MHRSGESQTFYVDLVAGRLGCGKETPRRMLKACVKAGWIAEHGDAQFRRYKATEDGREAAKSRPSAYDWTS